MVNVRHHFVSCVTIFSLCVVTARADDAKDYIAKTTAAAEGGNVDAMIDLSLCYLTGKDVERDVARGEQWLTKAYESGMDATAAWEAAIVFFNGTHADNKPDFAKADTWARRASERGSPDGARMAAQLADAGDVTGKPNHDEALIWYQIAADRNDPEGLNFIGVAELNGEGRAADPAKARVLFKKAADAGSVAALRNLSILYKNGRGVTKDEALAAEYQEKYEAAGGK